MTKETKSSTKYVMVESGSSVDEDEINLLEIVSTIIRGWKTIIGITLVFIVLAFVYASNAPEIFKAETILVPVDAESSSGISSGFGQFGGLAAAAGFNLPSDSKLNHVIATLESKKFLQNYITTNNLLPLLFEEIWDIESQSWLVSNQKDEPSAQKGALCFKTILSVDVEKNSGVINLSISWKDPVLAAKWANDLVKQLNEQLREKAIRDSKKRVGYLEQELAKTTLQDMRAVLYSLLESEKKNAMLANVNEDFALEVIDPAIVPFNRFKPNRKLIVVVGGLCGGFLGIFVIFFFQFLQKLKTNNTNQISHP